MTSESEGAPPNAPPQLSPDGAWWWTGQQWVPAHAATATTAVVSRVTTTPHRRTAVWSRRPGPWLSAALVALLVAGTAVVLPTVRAAMDAAPTSPLASQPVGADARQATLRVSAPAEWNALPAAGLDCTAIGNGNRTDVSEVKAVRMADDDLVLVVRNCVVSTGGAPSAVQAFRGVQASSAEPLPPLLTDADQASNIEITVQGTQLRLLAHVHEEHDPGCCSSGRLDATFTYTEGRFVPGPRIRSSASPSPDPAPVADGPADACHQTVMAHLRTMLRGGSEANEDIERWLAEGASSTPEYRIFSDRNYTAGLLAMKGGAAYALSTVDPLVAKDCLAIYQSLANPDPRMSDPSFANGFESAYADVWRYNVNRSSFGADYTASDHCKWVRDLYRGTDDTPVWKAGCLAGLKAGGVG